MRRATSFGLSKERENIENDSPHIKNKNIKKSEFTFESSKLKLPYDINEVLIKYNLKFCKFKNTQSFYKERIHINNSMEKYLVSCLFIDQSDIHFLRKKLFLSYFINLKKLNIENIDLDLSLIQDSNSLKILKIKNCVIKPTKLIFRNIIRLTLENIRIEIYELLNFLEKTFPCIESLSLHKINFTSKKNCLDEKELQKNKLLKLIIHLKNMKLKKISISHNELECDWLNSLIHINVINFINKDRFEFMLNNTYTNKNKLVISNFSTNSVSVNFSSIFRVFILEQNYYLNDWDLENFILSNKSIGMKLNNIKISFSKKDPKKIFLFLEKYSCIKKLNLSYTFLDNYSIQKIVEYHKKELRELNLEGFYISSELFNILKNSLKNCVLTYNDGRVINI